ncbi:MAG: preprotein translocase subunit SecG [Bacteroidales bacterium]|nr:preprotein translocase subunit SecG [Bacteroidales bacterium]MCF8457850.1 preprotein translocase subunit SecG [Bacteroidales bacterium]
MFTIVSGLILVVAILMILIVLVQNSKGGGLASNFSSSNQVMGVRKTTDFLEKTTWYLAIALLVFSIFASAVIPKDQTVESRSQLEMVDFTDAQQAAQFPTTAPATEPSGFEQPDNSGDPEQTE